MGQTVPGSPVSWTLTLIRQASAHLQQHPDAEPARQYLQARGVTLQEAALHDVGVMCPITEGTAQFLAWVKRYWVSWGGLTFPVIDALGTLVGVEIRLLPGEARPGQSPYADFQFARATGAPLAFGMATALPAVWTSERVILVEGVFDYFGVRATGATNVIANLTAAVATPMRRFLGRYAKIVIALLDMDQAGRASAQKLAQVGQEEGFLVVAPSYSVKDAGTFLQQGRIPELRALLAHYM